MTAETYDKIHAFMENTLMDGTGWVLAYAPVSSEDDEEPQPRTFTLLTNVKPEGVKELCRHIMENGMGARHDL